MSKNENGTHYGELALTNKEWAETLEKWADLSQKNMEEYPVERLLPEERRELEVKIMALRIGADAIMQRGPFSWLGEKERR